jgi:lipopolysaccharide exporter
LSQANKAMTASVLHVATKLSQRLLGLISTLILARLLAPDDFGIVAISLLIINFFTALSDSGASNYIIKVGDLTNSEIDTSWTINIILKLVVSVVILISANLIASIFNDERIVNLLYAMTIMLVLGSVSSPSIALFKREQNYVPIFKLEIIQKVISVIIVITIAVSYKSYWALIIGMMCTTTIGTFGSYCIHAYRPRLSLTNLTTQWDFSKWILGGSIFGFSRSQMDTFLTSKFYSVSDVGIFHTMKYIATMPGSQVIAPAVSPLLATISKSRDNETDFRDQINLSFYVVSLLSFPIAFYMCWNADILVLIILGDQWVNYSQIFGALSVLVISYSLSSLCGQILISLSKTKVLFIYNIISLLILVSLLLVAKNHSLYEFAATRVFFEIIASVSMFLFVVKVYLNIAIKKHIFIYFGSLITSYIALQASIILDPVDLNVFLRLFVTAITFNIVYLLSLYISYRVYFKRTKEGAHLAFLVMKTILKIKNKFVYYFNREKTGRKQ